MGGENLIRVDAAPREERLQSGKGNIISIEDFDADDAIGIIHVDEELVIH